MKIACLVSGGVDSSVALKMALDAGNDITAFYLKIWLEDETSFLGECPWEEDLAYVRKTCEQFSIPLEVVPLQKEYYARVVSYALEEVRRGRTPNPDVLCNSTVKFGAFLEWLEKKGKIFNKVVTGHYAGVEEQEGSYQLKMSKDNIKDQTYFLSRLSQKQLSKAWFPLGAYSKKEIRERAVEWKLPSANRPDSQGLCFLGKINYADFIQHHLGKKEGNIIDEDTNAILGRHKGHWLYTIGQRTGLNLSGGPWYVSGKNVEKNSIFVSHRLKMSERERNIFDISDMQFLEKEEKFNEGELYQVKVRHGAQIYSCTVEKLEERGTYRVRLLDVYERGIAPGQFAVFYKEDVCLGSGIVSC